MLCHVPASGGPSLQFQIEAGRRREFFPPRESRQAAGFLTWPANAGASRSFVAFEKGDTARAPRRFISSGETLLECGPRARSASLRSLAGFHNDLRSPPVRANGFVDHQKEPASPSKLI